MRSVLAIVVLLAWGPVSAGPLIVIAPNPCTPLAVHVPAADVAYVAGVDAEGRPVVPADLPSDGLTIRPRDVAVDIEVPLISAPDTERNRTQFDATAEIGTVTIGPDGEARLNGRPLVLGAVLPPGCPSRP